MSFKINSLYLFTTNSKFEEDYTSDGNTSLAKITKLNIF